MLDTTFILPTLGIDVGDKVSKALRRLAEAQLEIYYSHFSILESLWVAARTPQSAKFDGDRFQLGLRSIIEGGKYRRVNEDSEVFYEGLRLHRLGHQDFVDNILYAASVRFDLNLLTFDYELKNFVDDNGLKNTLILPSQLASL